MVLITEPITNPYHTSSPLMQPGFFDWQNRFEKRDNGGDPLQKLSSAVNGEIFGAELEALREKQRKSNAGAKPYDAVMMFKILIIQSLYHLSDEAVEYQILDRMSFTGFLGLHGRKLSEQEQQGNRRRARIRSRIEPVFGGQAVLW